MKKLFFVHLLVLSVVALFAQTKNEVAVLASVRSLHAAIFIDKDSAAIENLLAAEVTYGHSGGKLENRREVVENCSRNKSTYTNLNQNGISVSINGKTAVTRYLLTGTETKPDGKSTELKLNIFQVWVKEKKGWKMMARQAVKVS
jgi:ketosteroid isomerase-like protein